jgi:hypothetical protein
VDRHAHDGHAALRGGEGRTIRLDPGAPVTATSGVHHDSEGLYRLLVHQVTLRGEGREFAVAAAESVDLRGAACAERLSAATGIPLAGAAAGGAAPGRGPLSQP